VLKSSAQNSPTMGILAPNFVFLKESFPTIRKFSDKLKCRGGEAGNCPAATPL